MAYIRPGSGMSLWLARQVPGFPAELIRPCGSRSRRMHRAPGDSAICRRYVAE
jgi:hypothetical protein